MILIGDTYYEFKIGLKGLALLRQNLNFNVEDNLNFILYCGLIGQYPNIKIKDIELIKSNLSEVQKESIQQYIDQVSPRELTGLYSKCGEIGISPEEFFSLTPEEADELYEGYLKRKQFECNLILTSINQSKNRPEELIEFIKERGYEIGSQEEREHTFVSLGINEV